MRIKIILLALTLSLAQQAQARIVIQPKNKGQLKKVESIARQLGMTTINLNYALGHAVMDHPTYSVTDAINALHGNSLIKSVDEDRLVKPTSAPNDPFYLREWHIPRIGANTAWGTGTGTGIRIAVLDSGVTPVADLAPNLVTGTNIATPGGSTNDILGHGTAVAGAIASVCNNSMGVAGVACGAQIMPIVITNSQGTAYWSDIATAIQWAADHGARVINISFDNLTNSPVIDNAAQYARSNNAMVVTSAGNSGSNPGFYSNDPYLFTVSATDTNDARASFSSYGPYVDVAAPGVGIWTTNRDGTYGTWNGTSLASPIVAAVEAMMLSVNPALTPGQVEQTLQNTAVDLGTPGYDPYFGYGRINAAAAVQAAASQSGANTPITTNAVPAPVAAPSAPAAPATPAAPPAPATDTIAPSVTISTPANYAAVGSSTSITGGCGDNTGVVKVQLVVDGSVLGTSTAAAGQYFSSYVWNWSGYSLGTHTVQVIASDAAGNSRTATITIYRTY